MLAILTEYAWCCSACCMCFAPSSGIRGEKWFWRLCTKWLGALVIQVYTSISVLLRAAAHVPRVTGTEKPKCGLQAGAAWGSPYHYFRRGLDWVCFIGSSSPACLSFRTKNLCFPAASPAARACVSCLTLELSDKSWRQCQKQQAGSLFLRWIAS